MNLGLAPLTLLREGSIDAVNGGLLSTVGMTSLGAERCERVIVPSEFVHMMTIGLLAIPVPKPLLFYQSAMNCRETDTYIAIQPKGA